MTTYQLEHRQTLLYPDPGESLIAERRQNLERVRTLTRGMRSLNNGMLHANQNFISPSRFSASQNSEQVRLSDVHDSYIISQSLGRIFRRNDRLRTIDITDNSPNIEPRIRVYRSGMLPSSSISAIEYDRPLESIAESYRRNVPIISNTDYDGDDYSENSNTTFDRIMTESLIAEGYKDDLHKISEKYTCEMLVSLNILKPNISNDKCESGIYMCSEDDQQKGYSYCKCFCADKIKLCEACADSLVNNAIRCKGCTENSYMHDEIIFRF